MAFIGTPGAIAGSTAPEHLEQQLSRLLEYLRDAQGVVVLGGAGISVDSGIPSYRDGSGNWLGVDPIQHEDFVKQPLARARYWARSFVGWPAVANAQPNAAHQALAELERGGHIDLTVTQNVDRLHQRAGSRAVVDLHGRLDRVICLDCERLSERDEMQQRLAAANPAWRATGGLSRPDGDADVAATIINEANVPACLNCSGTLMPDVVFFGGNVPAARVQRCRDAISAADILLVVGSSLQVFSGFRFCRQAIAEGKALLIINPGATRADSIATARLDAPCAPLLQALSRELRRTSQGTDQPG